MRCSFQQEQEAKIAVISSIARSQEALARILGNIATISEHSEMTAKKIAENIHLLTLYQGVMSEMLTGIKLNRVKKGRPSSPWFQSGSAFTGRIGRD